MKKSKSILGNEQGFVLITSIMMLVVLMIIGIAATNTTTIELQISGNDRVYKESFYQADGGLQLAARLIEENLGSRGFTSLDTDKLLQDHPTTPSNTILIETANLWNNNDLTRDETDVSDAQRDVAYFPGGYDATNSNPRTNIIVDGVTSASEGAGMQMLAGYEGVGRGTAGGGGRILYTIYSQHRGRAQSDSIVSANWRHVIGQELEGRY